MEPDISLKKIITWQLMESTGGYVPCDHFYIIWINRSAKLIISEASVLPEIVNIYFASDAWRSAIRWGFFPGIICLNENLRIMNGWTGRSVCTLLHQSYSVWGNNSAIKFILNILTILIIQSVVHSSYTSLLSNFSLIIYIILSCFDCW